MAWQKGSSMEERFETFTTLIAKISRNIRKIKNQEMALYGLRSTQVSCLYYLHLEQGLTASDLCLRCEEDKATISRALDTLEEGGYILRDSASAKRYKSPIALTEKGLAVGKEIAEKIDFVLEEVGECLSEEERLAFYRGLTLISDRLESVAVLSEEKAKKGC